MDDKTYMTTEETDRTQTALKQLLKEMSLICFAEDDSRIPAIVSRLHKMYVTEFRHRYSEFFPMLVEIDEEAPEFGLEFLSNNIIAVRKYVDSNCTSGDGTYKSLYKPLMKLSDHLNLEIARYNHFVGQNERIMEQNKLLTVQNEQITELKKQNQDLQKQLANATAKLDQANTRFSQTEVKLTDAETKLADAETKLTDAETKLQAIETNIKTANENIGDTEKKISSIHIDIIAVLSIFASIVLAFSGSMTVLGSALTGMQEVHAFKATFFVLLCGFVLGNIIFLLMYLVGKLTSRNIYARCKTEECTCNPPCNGFTRIRKRLPYIYWMNLILIVLMALVIFFWYLDRSCHINIFSVFDFFASRFNH